MFGKKRNIVEQENKTDKVVLSIAQASDLMQSISSIPQLPEYVSETVKTQMALMNSLNNKNVSLALLDTMFFSLDKAIKQAPDNQTIEFLKERFAFFVQNFLLMSEIRMQLVINRDDLKEMLNEAGKMMCDSFKAVSLFAVKTAGVFFRMTGSAIEVAGHIAVGSITQSLNIAGIVANNAVTSGSTALMTSAVAGTMDSDDSKISALDTSGKIISSIAESSNNNLKEVTKTNNELAIEEMGKIHESTKLIDNIAIDYSAELENLVEDSSSSRKKHLSRFIDAFVFHLHKKEIIAKEESKYYSVVDDTISKLCKYRKLIGKSIIITETIDRYLRDLQQYEKKGLLKEKEHLNNYKADIKKEYEKIGLISISGVLAVSVIVAIIRSIVYHVKNFIPSGWLLSHLIISFAFCSICFSIVFIIYQRNRKHVEECIKNVDIQLGAINDKVGVLRKKAEDFDNYIDE